VPAQKRLEDAYRFPGFRPSRWVHGVFGDPKARVMVLERVEKKQLAVSAGECRRRFTTAGRGVCETSRVGIRGSIWWSKSGV
jgi:hypothetical protein